ncbi:hypothetical protein [Bradyrhizobium sp. 159]|uniref:hypothetical protein n=1 Tax=Bradyrhizobium sp. 159 TaxID=2782632 RepID=UPI001FF7832A|nr:hypothetical protein [Bradyrhizobium sp. 159]
MSTRSPYRIAARPSRNAGRVTVAVIADPNFALVAKPEQLGRWWCLTPPALWSTVSVRGTDPEELLHGVASVLARQKVDARRLILIAEGQAARAALELVLHGAIDCAGLLAIAVPCAALSFRVVPIATAIRLVVRREDSSADLIAALRAADIDTRIIGFDSATANGARAAASAAETFVLELVANASRQNRHHGA